MHRMLMYSNTLFLYALAHWTSLLGDGCTTLCKTEMQAHTKERKTKSRYLQALWYGKRLMNRQGLTDEASLKVYMFLISDVEISTKQILARLQWKFSQHILLS